MQYFINDYSEGCHPKILEKLLESNEQKHLGYGDDAYSGAAKEKIRKACACPEAEVYFLVGGTQTNMTVINAILRTYQGVICVNSGHIAVHEAGAIEKGGHKVLAVDGENGKIAVKSLKNFMDAFDKDLNKEHTVFPGMVYVSQPTEYGTLYSKKELEEIKKICIKYEMPLFVDGARLGYALASPANDVSLEDLTRLSDVFYIGGTKCGALFGEAVVLPKQNYIPHFKTIIKQNGALLAKGRVLGIQFDTLFTDDLYKNICESAVRQALRIKDALLSKSYELYVDSPTNQQFIIIDNSKMEELSKKVAFGYMESYDDNRSVIRFCTSFATRDEDVEALIDLL